MFNYLKNKFKKSYNTLKICRGGLEKFSILKKEKKLVKDKLYYVESEKEIHIALSDCESKCLCNHETGIVIW
jgi:hypothetical protein